MLYGRSLPGGLVAMTTKKPQHETRRQLQFSYGSHDYKQTAFDFTGPLEDERIAYRLAGVVKDADNQVDGIEEQRYAVMPSVSIKAEPSVAWVDRNVARHGTARQAQAYLRFLYTPQGQQLIARHYYRPAEPDAVPAALRGQFPPVKLVTIDDAFGGWKKAQATHFADGGLFDRIYRPGR